MNLLGGLHCRLCGFNDYRALEFDHINGGGKNDKVKRGGNKAMYIHYLNHPEEAKQTLQVLCSNCNSIKKHSKREY